MSGYFENKYFTTMIKKHDCGRKRVSRTDQPCGKKKNQRGKKGFPSLT